MVLVGQIDHFALWSEADWTAHTAAGEADYAAAFAALVEHVVHDADCPLSALRLGPAAAPMDPDQQDIMSRLLPPGARVVGVTPTRVVIEAEYRTGGGTHRKAVQPKNLVRGATR